MTKILFGAAAVLLALAACSKPENNNGNNQNGNGNGNTKENTPIVLRASTTTPVMDRDHQDEVVLTLQWNATTNMGTGARVEYAVLIDRKGGTFEGAHEISLGANVLSFSCTARELSEMAKEVRSASAKEQQKENPKYAMRTWLLRLGFIGDEFKTARELLTRRLDGDAAFRNGRAA